MENEKSKMRFNGGTARKIGFYVLAVLINLALNRVVNFYNLPLFIDNVGTLLAAAIGGYLPGIIVGYLTNIINMTASPENAYYAVLSVMIAACGAFFASKGVFKSYWKTRATVPVFALIGGVGGSILTFLMYGFGMGEGISAPFAKILLADGTLTVFQAQMISDVAIDLMDKFITVTAVFVILSVLPQKFKDSLKLTGWRQTPLSDDNKKIALKHASVRLSLRRKIILIIAGIMIFVAFVTTSISFLLYKNFAIDQYSYTGRSVAQLVASTIDGDMVETYLEEGRKAEGYAATVKRLESIKETTPEVEYIYVYRIEIDGCHVVFDLDTEELEGAEPGTIIPFDESFMELVPDLLAGKNIEPMITDDTYGWLLTDYEPIYDSEGKCVAYAAADIQMQDVTLNSINFLTKVSSLFIGFFILILVLCLWLADYNLIFPLDAMTISARKFAYDSEEDLEIGVARLKRLNIQTGDEIENLYESVSKTMAQTVGYLEQVKEKGDELAKMQNGLIYVLADLVESRDKNTGDHVRKTAAYVKLMLNHMKEEGIYADMLTDDYIYDVTNSAPLHDVGKIKVSDVILNKPGKLDDSEFAIMKNHTTAGEEILKSAISLVSDNGYLKEAKNLATYHHEKWDGSGYPIGLKGEDIPLSARIMAIADVFDALVSKRSYKRPFTFEQAMDIIREGAGKHFDPVLADLFVRCSDEVRQIAEEHERIIDNGGKVSVTLDEAKSEQKNGEAAKEAEVEAEAEKQEAKETEEEKDEA